MFSKFFKGIAAAIGLIEKILFQSWEKQHRNGYAWFDIQYVI